jgi:glycosyltransferase involved in cell wall biosynthesis
MHDQNPKVSVVIPTYNRAHLICRSIQSVLDQTYQNLEIIVVDDGSTDNTEEIVINFKDERIRYIKHSENKGASAARNTGIKVSRGEYIAFQDSDDEWFSEKLEKQISAFYNSSPEVGVVYSGFYRVEANKKIYIPSDDHVAQKKGNIYNELLKGNFVGTPAVLIKKECFENVKYFDENIPALEDWELWIEISKYYKFEYINIPLVYSYSTPNSVNLNQKNILKAYEIILKNHLNDFGNNKKILSTHYFFIACGLFQTNDFKNGRVYLTKAIKANNLNTCAILYLIVSLFGPAVYLNFRYIYLKITRKI